MAEHGVLVMIFVKCFRKKLSHIHVEPVGAQRATQEAGERVLAAVIAFKTLMPILRTTDPPSPRSTRSAPE